MSKVNTHNLALMTDSYKQGHYKMLMPNTENYYDYYESRSGSKYPYTVFFGLQYLLMEYLEGVAVTQDDIEEADVVCTAHLGPNSFNREGWQHIVDNHGGKLPIKIKAVPEGLPVSISNVLMTIEATDPKCAWLVGFLEPVLMKVWYSSNVATISRFTKEMISKYLEETSDSSDGIGFMLHDFGFRSSSSQESSGIAGAAHLISFLGTDTIPALQYARKYYGADLATLGFSVSASEHSVMTQAGPSGELDVLDLLLERHPTGILSVVSDSYDIYKFVREVGKRAELIKERDGVFVVRPDSVTRQHTTPECLTLALVQMLNEDFGSEVNSKGFKVLDSHVRVLWGDGIDYEGIEKIIKVVTEAGFSAENLVFGQGGHLLHNHTRDTQRTAIKASAIKRDGQWNEIWKKPLDLSKMSKRGRLSLIEYEGKITTVSTPDHKDDILELVFENGEIKRHQTFADIRERANRD